MFSLHAKVALLTTLILLVIGTIVLFFLEYNNEIRLVIGIGGIKLIGTFFLSTTSRTAGYTLMDTGALHEASLFFIIILMFLGHLLVLLVVG